MAESSRSSSSCVQGYSRPLCSDRNPARAETGNSKRIVEKDRSSENLHCDVWRKTIVELVFFGRMPSDIVTIENSSPEHLSVPATPLDQMEQTLQKLAMKSYLQARQRGDLRRDIAARLLPSEGPFRPGDRVYFWQTDKKQNKARHHF